MSSLVPVELQEAAIEVCGTAFYYKLDHSRLQRIMFSAGVPETMWRRHATPENSKYIIARRIFGDLEAKGRSGAEVQRRIVEELCALSGPESKAVDQRAGVAALAKLKKATLDAGVLVDRERIDAERRAHAETARLARLSERSGALLELRSQFMAPMEEPPAPHRNVATAWRNSSASCVGSTKWNSVLLTGLLRSR